MRIVSELEFRERILQQLSQLPELDEIGAVTGPGRSGAVAAVYASHITGLPFFPYGQRPPFDLNRLLIIDTARQSGKTLRKAVKSYALHDPVPLAIFEEPPRVIFWYESQTFERHGSSGDLSPLAA